VPELESFLLLASVYLGAAVLIVPIAVRLGLGSVLGYLAAGILLGPVLGFAGTESRDLQHFAEFGVVMMLFLIGLELEPRTLWDMRHKLLGLGGLQITLSAAAIAGAVLWLGQPWPVAVTIGLMMSLSSTAIVLQTLSEKNLMRTGGGRSSFAVLLTQDIAVVPMIALIPLLAPLRAPARGAESHAAGAEHGVEGAAEPILTLIQSLPGWAVTGLTLAIVAAIVLGGHFLTRPVFRFVHASHLPEMSTFISLLMVLGIAFLMILVGLSPALGTFVAGVVLANSEFRHQLEADIKPFKGILLGLFFMTVGISIDVGVIAAQPLTILGLTLGLIAIKAAVLLTLALVFRLRGRDRWLFTLGLAQAGEFGFLITSFATQQAILPGSVAQIALMVISLSMLLTPALFIAHDLLARRFHRESAQPDDAIDEKGRVIIAGVGRFGQVVNRMARMSGLSTTVLDSDMAAIDMLRRFGTRGSLATRPAPKRLRRRALWRRRFWLWLWMISTMPSRS
jgi:monovalent cation:H+ antiporter-2, CPA2 family